MGLIAHIIEYSLHQQTRNIQRYEVYHPSLNRSMTCCG
nr:MAG TPA: hypothetical protein [Caudoviricetes sp.]